LFEQLVTLITSGTGSLAYHIVLAFSIAGALLITLNHNIQEIQVRRTVFGLSLLLIIQLSLFLGAGIIWQGVVEGSVWLFFFENTGNLLSLIVIVWLWAFPKPSSTADTVVMLSGLLLIIFSLLVFSWWSEQIIEYEFSDSSVITLSQIFSLLITIAGCVILILNRPQDWGYGISMLIMLLIGEIISLITIQTRYEVIGIMRLAQMAAYPFLLILPQRLQCVARGNSSIPDHESTDEIEGVKQLVGSSDNRFADPQIWDSLYQMSTEIDPKRLSNAIVANVAQAVRADICLLLAPIDENGNIRVLSGYNMVQERFLEKISFDSRRLPVLSYAMRMGRSRRFFPNTTSPDLAEISRSLNIPSMGYLFFLPILEKDGKLVSGIVLMNLDPNIEWSQVDETFLKAYVKVLVQFLQHNRKMVDVGNEMVRVRQVVNLIQRQVQQTLDENRRLGDKLVVMSEREEKDRAQITSLATILEANKTAREAFEIFSSQKSETITTERETVPTTVPTNGELHMALQEISLLRTALSEAEEQIASIEISRPTKAFPSDNVEIMLSLAQDLRRPVSAIIGYTDFLLSEVVGILGSSQRNYLERVKSSTERLGRLLDDLLLAVSTETGGVQIGFIEVDIHDTISQAINFLDDILLEKEIVFQLDYPDQEIRITTDPDVLREIFNQLLLNACLVSPKNGEVKLSVDLKSSDTINDYVLIQIIDHGPGIPTQDIQRLFSHRAAEDEITGVSDKEIELQGIKTKVDLLGGRIWVESEPGEGASFSIILPISPSSALEDTVEIE